MEDFDFSFNPSINRHQIMDLATAGFVNERKTSFSLAGWCRQNPPGLRLGSPVAVGIRRPVRQDAELLRHLAVSHADGSWEAKLAHYLKPIS